MRGQKVYNHPWGYVLDTIHDIVELQNGRILISDAVHGRVFYRLEMYGYEWELLYTVAQSGAKKCTVTIEVSGERRDKAEEIHRGFALLDSMLSGSPNVKIFDFDETESGRSV